jgi:hypothetical protein
MVFGNDEKRIAHALKLTYMQNNFSKKCKVEKSVELKLICPHYPAGAG